MREACAALRPHLGDTPVLSIAAGVRTDAMARWLGGNARLLRCMPNTPALIGMGIAALYAGPGVTQAGRDVAQTVLEAVGKVVWVEDEAQLDPVTAVSGSGPAYVFYFIEALQEASRALGLSDERRPPARHRDLPRRGRARRAFARHRRRRCANA